MVTEKAIDSLQKLGITGKDTFSVLKATIEEKDSVTSWGTGYTLERVGDMFLIGTESLGKITYLCLEIGLKDREGYITGKTLELVGKEKRDGKTVIVCHILALREKRENVGYTFLVDFLGLLVFMMDPLSITLGVYNGLEGCGNTEERALAGILKGMGLCFDLST